MAAAGGGGAAAPPLAASGAASRRPGLGRRREDASAVSTAGHAGGRGGRPAPGSVGGRAVFRDDRGLERGYSPVPGPSPGSGRRLSVKGRAGAAKRAVAGARGSPPRPAVGQAPRVGRPAARGRCLPPAPALACSCRGTPAAFTDKPEQQRRLKPAA